MRAGFIISLFFKPKVKTQRAEVICPNSHSRYMAPPGLGLQSPELCLGCIPHHSVLQAPSRSVTSSAGETRYPGPGPVENSTCDPGLCIKSPNVRALENQETPSGDPPTSSIPLSSGIAGCSHLIPQKDFRTFHVLICGCNSKSQ